jgi:alginate O-acetyltransferase complex protein AlgI
VLFNSISFGIFLPVVFLLYWALTKKGVKAQNILLLAASYFFYACWDWRFLFLLSFSIVLDYFTGHKIAGATGERSKKTWLWLSICINLGFLGLFKYYNFFAESFAYAISNLGFHTSTWTLKVILPLGISFYTFHGLSYVFDIYRGKVRPEKSFIDYALFVSFFPLLVAGPIERATHLLPQVREKRTFDYAKAVDGLRQILWGLFKKVVIADSCAQFANMAFDHSTAYPGSILILGAFFFAFQIYCDFSGYSDIALGTARLFGIELLRNFAFPYFSRDIAEFWRRWHISLTSWFRDYVYIPLGGSKVSKWKQVRNIFIVFLLSGLWHGANFTFLAWGAINAFYFLPLLLMKKNRTHLDIVAKGRLMPSAREVIQMFITFCLTTFAWIFFRSVTLANAFSYVKGIFSKPFFGFPGMPKASLWAAGTTLCLIAAFTVVEWCGREQPYAIARTAYSWGRPLRWGVYAFIIFMIGMFMQSTETPFIYFQF